MTGWGARQLWLGTVARLVVNIRRKGLKTMRCRILQTIAAFCAIALLAACDEPQTQRQAPPAEALAASTQSVPSTLPQPLDANPKVAALAAGILAMSDRIDPQEAARAARIAYQHSATLKAQYRVTDGPLVHNIKVNRGEKPRGLCWHWAEDMEKRLKAENFRTLQLHRAIANYDNWRLEHSTAIISLRGASMYDGMVLDPWRKGGTLFWERVRADTRYNWTPRLEVFDWKRERGLLTTRYVNEAGVPVAAR